MKKLAKGYCMLAGFRSAVSCGFSASVCAFSVAAV